MNTYQTKLIKEHSELVGRIDRLQLWIYGEGQHRDDKIEYANKAIQLAAMKKYEEALRARIENTGIVFEQGQYFERVTPESEPVSTSTGSDNDIDNGK
jgi:hypothetical protein